MFHTPFFLSLILPMSVLVASLVTIGTMKEQRVDQIRACGIGYAGAARTVRGCVGASMFAAGMEYR